MRSTHTRVGRCFRLYWQIRLLTYPTCRNPLARINIFGGYHASYILSSYLHLAFCSLGLKFIWLIFRFQLRWKCWSSDKLYSDAVRSGSSDEDVASPNRWEICLRMRYILRGLRERDLGRVNTVIWFLSVLFAFLSRFFC
jgi:hypothetical protein